MSKTLLLTRTRHDNHNEYLYAYSEEILSEAKSRGWTVHKVEDEEVNRKNIISRLSKINYNMVIFNGHGGENVLFGHNDEIALTSEKDAGLFEGKIGFLRACQSLTWFGKAAVDKGARCVIGYLGPFSFYTLNRYSTTPKKDPLAKPVFEVSNIVPMKLLKGATAEEALKAAKMEAKAKVRGLLARKNDQYTQLLVDILRDNEISLDIEGDRSATL